MSWSAPDTPIGGVRSVAMLLALDSATTTGAAWGELGGQPQWATFAAKGDSLGEKISRFRFWLMSRVMALRPEWILYEAPYIPVPRAPRFAAAGTAVSRAPSGPPMNAATIELLCGFTGTIQEIAFERQIKCRSATVLEITRWFTGTVKHGGRANKKAATIEACRRLGWDTVSDDAADALALWAFAEHVLAPQLASRRAAGAALELPLHGTLARPAQDRIGRRSGVL